MSNIQNAIGQLQYFVGKLCTIFTCSINNEFQASNPHDYAQQVTNYFTGTIQVIDEVGITITQLRGDLRAYFFIHNVVSIVEEKVLDPENAEDAKILSKIQEKPLSKGVEIIDNPTSEQKTMAEQAQVALEEQQNQAKNLVKNMVGEVVKEQLEELQGNSGDSIDVDGLANLSKSLNAAMADEKPIDPAP